MATVIDSNKDTIKRNLTAQNNSKLSDGLGFFDDILQIEKQKTMEKKKSNRELLF